MRSRRQNAALVVAATVWSLGAVWASGAVAGRAVERTAPRQLLVVLDGLRPDYVTPELMPRLHAVGEGGVVFERHHAVFPTVTRVNASSISTGAYPSTHGLLGNSVFFPVADPTRFLNTAVRENLLAIEAAIAPERILTAPTLGEQLAAAGHDLLVVSAGSAGSSYLLHHTGDGGGIVHYEYARPATLGDAVRAAVGEPPAAGLPNDARNRWAVDALLEVGLDLVDPTVVVLWLSDPDTTAHARGMGAPETDEALRRLDVEIGRLVDRLSAPEAADPFDIWVTSDHGFSTHTGGVDLERVLAPFAGRLVDGTPQVVGGNGAIDVRDDDPVTIRRLVRTLQADPTVGAIFTAARDPRSPLDGWVPGTLSFAAARWDHRRATDVLFSASWTSETNEHGYPGTSARGGTAGHGSSSPWDIHNTLVAAGPSLAAGTRVTAPSSNVDLAPTFLTLLGLDVPDSMEGRVLREARTGSTAAPEVSSTTHAVTTYEGRYRLSATWSVVEEHRYLDFTTVTRGGAEGPAR